MVTLHGVVCGVGLEVSSGERALLVVMTKEEQQELDRSMDSELRLAGWLYMPLSREGTKRAGEGASIIRVPIESSEGLDALVDRLFGHAVELHVDRGVTEVLDLGVSSQGWTEEELHLEIAADLKDKHGAAYGLIGRRDMLPPEELHTTEAVSEFVRLMDEGLPPVMAFTLTTVASRIARRVKEEQCVMPGAMARITAEVLDGLEPKFAGELETALTTAATAIEGLGVEVITATVLSRIMSGVVRMTTPPKLREVIEGLQKRGAKTGHGKMFNKTLEQLRDKMGQRTPRQMDRGKEEGDEWPVN